MEEQNRQDPGGLKRHGDPLSESGADVRKGAGQGAGAPANRPGMNQPEKSGQGMGQGGTGAGRPGEAGVSGRPISSGAAGRPGNPPQWTSGGGTGAAGAQGGGAIGRGSVGGGMSGRGSIGAGGGGMGGGSVGGSSLSGGSTGSSMGTHRFGESFGGTAAVAEKLRTNVERVADSGIHRLAEEIRSIGAASHAAVDKLDRQEHGEVGKYVEDVTRRFEGAADYIEQKGFDGIVRDASDLARRNPALFLGAAALAGFVLGRIVSASRPREGQGYSGMNSYGREGSLFDRTGEHEERRPI